MLLQLQISKLGLHIHVQENSPLRRVVFEQGYD